MYGKTKKKSTESPKPQPAPEVKEEKKEEKPVAPTEEFTLTRDVNLTLKKGMKVSKEKHDKMVANGFARWFQ